MGDLPPSAADDTRQSSSAKLRVFAEYAKDQGVDGPHAAQDEELQDAQTECTQGRGAVPLVQEGDDVREDVQLAVWDGWWLVVGFVGNVLVLVDVKAVVYYQAEGDIEHARALEYFVRELNLHQAGGRCVAKHGAVNG